MRFSRVKVLLAILTSFESQVGNFLRPIKNRPQLRSIPADLASILDSGRPCRSRTCDTLIKRYRPIVPPSATG